MSTDEMTNKCIIYESYVLPVPHENAVSMTSCTRAMLQSVHCLVIGGKGAEVGSTG